MFRLSSVSAINYLSLSADTAAVLHMKAHARVLMLNNVQWNSYEHFSLDINFSKSKQQDIEAAAVFERKSVVKAGEEDTDVHMCAS